MPTSTDKHSHSDSRFQQVDQEIAGVKKDIGGIQMEIGEVRGDIRSLNTGQSILQQNQTEGFRDIKEALSESKSAPTKISAGMLISVIGLFITAGAIGVAAFWAAVMLLFSPLKEDIHDHATQEGHIDAMPRLVSMEKEVAENRRDIMASGAKSRQELVSAQALQEQRNLAVKEQVTILANKIGILNKDTLEKARILGQMEKQDEWHSADISMAQEQRDALRVKADDAHAAAASLKSQVDILIQSINNNTLKAAMSDTESALLRGKLEALEKLVTEIDSAGSRRWNSDKKQSGK